ncbi:SEL1-like repeat protein [Brevundimonas sp.]|uniref:SEL1-like repeat protein n=1 Tax=Brevundimonas sp. TaxID=1871086 RepID=UPI002FCC23C1
MSATAPWSVKGIDPKAREIAKDLARRSGMTLGEWLNSMIMDEPEDEGSALPRRTLAPDSLERPTREGGARIDALVSTMGERLEAAERRSTSAIQGIDLAVSSLMRRMDAERELDTQRERRLEGMARELREGHERLKSLEGGDAGLDLRGRLDQAQNDTRSALEGLQVSFAALEQKLGGLEARPALGDGALTQLADGLRQQIEANRQDMMVRLGATGDAARLGNVEQTLDRLLTQTKAAEMRSAHAVEAMGQEVMRIARNMNTRMQGLEENGLGKTQEMLDQRLSELGRVLDEKLDREIARHSQSVDSRLTRQEDQHALALERLGGEITRISDRLSERISQTERRSSQAIEDISRRLAENTDKLERRSEDVSGELAERMRQSEERTLRLVEEAKAVRARRESAALHAAPRLAVADPVVFDDVPEFIAETPAVSLFGSASDEWMPQPEGRTDWRANAAAQNTNPIDAALHGGALDAPLTEAQASPGWADTVAAEMAVEPFPTQDEMRPFGSLDGELEDDFLIDEARPASDGDREDFPSIFASSEHEALAARNEAPVEVETLATPDEAFEVAPADSVEPADANPFFAAPEEVEAAQDDDLSLTPFRSTRDVIDNARAAISDDDGDAPRKGFGLSKLRKKGGTSALQQKLDRKASREGSTFGQALKVSALAMLVVGGGGYGTLKLVKDQNLDLNFGHAPTPTQPTTPIAAPMAALALDATPTDAVPSQDVAQTEGAAIFNRAIAMIENGDASGLEPLKRSAELGYVPAQMRLATLYTDGGAGIEADPFEARQWVRRAAEAGEPRAMQHYATQLYDGVGGERDEAKAVEWMRKSAEAGSVDSQYNVAHLYEKGVKGVAANKAEAFTWYMIAARRGDQQALEAVQRLTPTLEVSQRAKARETANNFTVQPLA